MTSRLPKMTIVTPSYNQAGFIEETIQSVLDQNYPDLEYLIMDAGSTDGTLDILRRYDRHLHWISRKDRGQSDALNQAFRKAQGEVLAYINSDDRYEPGALRRVGEYFADRPEAQWVTGKCRLIDQHGNEIRRPVTWYKNFWLLWKSYAVLQVLDYISQPATFWRRPLVERIGWFDEQEHLAMDYDYSLRAGQYFHLHRINAYLAAFRVHPESKSAQVREHFERDLAVAHRYARSRWLYELHRLHNFLIVSVYLGWGGAGMASDGPSG